MTLNKSSVFQKYRCFQHAVKSITDENADKPIKCASNN